MDIEPTFRLVPTFDRLVACSHSHYVQGSSALCVGPRQGDMHVYEFGN
jgi:hypothetical protein